MIIGALGPVPKDLEIGRKEFAQSAGAVEYTNCFSAQG